MNRMVVFFFSGTGNTWWVSEQIVENLHKKGVSAQALSIEALSVADAEAFINESDLVGFGYPIYGSDVPQPMQAFLARLPEYRGKPCFVFCTQWLWSSDGARTGADFLSERGFSVRWGEHFFMPNNVCIEMIPLPYTNDPKRIGRTLARCERRIARFTERIVSGQQFLRGFNPVAFALGCVQRVPFRRMKSAMQDDMQVDQERCTLCGYCVRLCPSGNLDLREGLVATHGTCIFCMRCYNFCPESAVMHRKRRHNLRRGVPYRGPQPSFDPTRLTAEQAAGRK